MLSRRHLIAVSAASVFAPSVLRIARAGTWPDRAVHLVVPIAAGGPTDTNARLVAEQLSKIWGQQVVVDNKSGAGTNIGNEFVAHSDPDGYTLLYGTSSLSANARLVPLARLQSRSGFRADLAGGEISVLHVRAEFLAGQDGEGFHRQRQCASRQAHHGLARHRQRAASRRGAVYADGEDQDDACALSRRGAGVHRSHSRPHRLLFRQRRTA